MEQTLPDMKLIVAEKAVQLTAYFFACVSFNSCFLHRSFLNLTVKNTKNWSTFAEDIEKNKWPTFSQTLGTWTFCISILA